jgi:hypothetical protein
MRVPSRDRPSVYFVSRVHTRRVGDKFPALRWVMVHQGSAAQRALRRWASGVADNHQRCEPCAVVREPRPTKYVGRTLNVPLDRSPNAGYTVLARERFTLPRSG